MYQVGQKVKIVDKRPPNERDINWVPDMDALCGQILTIQKIGKSNGYIYVEETMRYFHPKWIQANIVPIVTPIDFGML